MQITFTPTIFQKNRQNNCPKNATYPNLSPLKYDMVSFSAMKKKEFEGIDFAVVEKFKAPICNFNSNKDFQKWAREKALGIANKNYDGRSEEIKIQRKHMLKEWSDYVLNQNDAYTASTALLILNAITKDLKPDNDKIPPALNKGVLADCINEIDENTRKDSKYQFDLNKMYNNKLRAFYLDDNRCAATGEYETKWVIIPSRTHDPENFDANVDKLKTLSYKTWCTKSFNARPYLSKGDFHVYLENGEPKIGVRFHKDKIKEIQGERNNGMIPINYLDEIENHIKNNNLPLENLANKQLNKAHKIKPIITKIKADLNEAIGNNDTKAIFKYFKIKVTEDKDGYLTISHYKQPSRDYSFYELGINEKKLFEKVRTISGHADFENSQIIDLGNLETIGGFASFKNSQIKDLGNLKSIGLYANFKNSQVTDLKNLRSIGGDAFFYNSKVEDLGKLEFIGGDAFFENSKVRDLGKLKHISGNAIIFDSPLKITDFAKIKIGGSISSTQI